MKKFKLSNQVLESLPISICIGLEELENRFLKMELSLLSNQKFVEQIRDSIETFFLALEDAHCKGHANSRLLDQLDSIEDGIQFIKGAMTNRLLASRYLYEPLLFNPHNMGPISKLYLFYESFVDLFERLVRKYNRNKNEMGAYSRVSFLVDISTYSSVNSQVFVPYACQKSPENVIVGITINEHSFFQIKTTMILLLHEIGHYTRPFQRAKRNKILLKVVIGWLKNMVYGQLKDYIYPALSSTSLQLETNETKEKIDTVREHFEQEVFPIVDAIVSKTLTTYFEDFIKSPKATSAFGNKDQFVNHLGQFQELLESFMTDLSNDLSAILLLPVKEKDESNDEPTELKEEIPNFDVRSRIIKLLMSEVEIEEEDDQEAVVDKTIYFNRLCVAATGLFNSEEIFGYKIGVGNSGPDAAIDSYFKSLALLSLNEVSRDNAYHFATVLIRCLKRALETMKEESVLNMLMRNLEESLAHMFWIRTLNIRDVDSYWEIFEPLMKQASHSEKDHIKFFGIPNAIITEYFYMLNTGVPQEEPKYHVPPIDSTTPLPRILESGNSTIAEEKWIKDLHYIFFVPVATYLLEEEDVFPEKQFFQIHNGQPFSEDAKLIEKLRERFAQFVIDSKSENEFAHEIEMIGFFEKDNTK